MNSIILWLAARWAEPSTHAGLSALASVVVPLLPAPYQILAQAAMVVFGGNAVLKADAPKPAAVATAAPAAPQAPDLTA